MPFVQRLDGHHPNNGIPNLVEIASQRFSFPGVEIRGIAVDSHTVSSTTVILLGEVDPQRSNSTVTLRSGEKQIIGEQQRTWMLPPVSTLMFASVSLREQANSRVTCLYLILGMWLTHRFSIVPILEEVSTTQIGQNGREVLLGFKGKVRALEYSTMESFFYY